jgi:DNA-3-methyladenine glycosylase
MRIRPLRRAHLPIDTTELARFLVGKTLVHDHPAGRLSGRIVETEAYVIGDAACHAFRGATPRNKSLFLERGHAYVCLVYGSSFLLNVSGEVPGVGAGVLLRALEPLEGIELMEQARDTTRRRDLARGPGRLVDAMLVDETYDGYDLCSGERLWLGTASAPTRAIGESVRIGITKEANRVLRFFELDNPFVSGPRKLNQSLTQRRKEAKTQVTIV